MAPRLEDVLARRLRELAGARKVPLSHAADRAGVARSYLWRLLDGESSASLAVIQRLADAIGVAALDLLSCGGDITSAAPEPPVRRSRRKAPSGKPSASGKPRRKPIAKK